MKTLKDNRFFLILLVALFSMAAYVHVLAKEITYSPFSDFGNYWLNATLVKEGVNPWLRSERSDAERERIVKKYNFLIPWPSVNSIGFMMFMQLFALYDFRPAVILWTIMGYILLLCSAWIILRTIEDRPLFEDLLFTAFLIFSFWPIREALHDGQVCFLTLFFMASGIYCLKYKKWFLAGILLSMAVQTKEYLAISLLVFLWKRNWGVLAGSLVGVLSVKAAGIIIYGWTWELAYMQWIFQFGGNFHSSMVNHSMTSALYRLGADVMSAVQCRLLSGALIGALAALAIHWTHRTTDMVLGYLPFLVLSFLASPWIHESHYVILYPAIIILWFAISAQAPSNINYSLFIVMYLLLGLGYSLIGFPSFHTGITALLAAGKTLGIVALFVLAGRVAHESGHAP